MQKYKGQPADLEPLADEIDDVAAIVGVDPAIDAVNCDDVEIGQRLVRGELGETRIVEMHVARSRRRGQGSGAQYMGGIEVVGIDFDVGRGRRHNVGRIALPAHQFAVGERSARVGRGEAGRQSREVQDGGDELAIDAIGLGDVRDIAGAPITHANFASYSAQNERTADL